MPHRMIEVVCREQECASIRGSIEQAEPLACWTTVSSHGERHNVRALVDGARVAALLEDLDEQCTSPDGPRVVVFNVEATLPTPDDNEASEDEDHDNGALSRIELVDRLGEEVALSPIYAWMVALSSVVAAVGLVRGNVAVIVGAMVIASLLAPNMALALAATLADVRLGLKALRSGLVGVAIAVVLGLAAGRVLPVDPDAAEIAGRTAVDALDLILALAAGAAGALALTAGVSGALVGMMAAVALLPPLIAAALLAGAGFAADALGALLLYSANVAALNLSGIVVFLARGVTPRRYWEAQRAQRFAWAGMAFWVLALAVLIAAIMLINGG